MPKILFLGQRQIAWRALEILASEENRRDLPIVGLVSDPTTYKHFTERLYSNSVPFVSNDRRRSEEIISLIENTQADTLISIQHNWILSTKIIAKVGRNAFNLHNAPLPAYQGYNTISHAILNGESEYESTIHRMTEEVDSGPIVFQGTTLIAEDDTALSLHRKTIETAIVTFQRLLHLLRRGDRIDEQACPDRPSRFYGKDDLLPLLDVTQVEDPTTLERRARALFYPPHNIAFRTIDGRRVYLVPGNALDDLTSLGSSISPR